MKILTPLLDSQAVAISNCRLRLDLFAAVSNFLLLWCLQSVYILDLRDAATSYSSFKPSECCTYYILVKCRLSGFYAVFYNRLYDFLPGNSRCLMF